MRSISRSHYWPYFQFHTKCESHRGIRCWFFGVSVPVHPVCSISMRFAIDAPYTTCRYRVLFVASKSSFRRCITYLTVFFLILNNNNKIYVELKKPFFTSQSSRSFFAFSVICWQFERQENMNFELMMRPLPTLRVGVIFNWISIYIHRCDVNVC